MVTKEMEKKEEGECGMEKVDSDGGGREKRQCECRKERKKDSRGGGRRKMGRRGTGECQT